MGWCWEESEDLTWKDVWCVRHDDPASFSRGETLWCSGPDVAFLSVPSSTSVQPSWREKTPRELLGRRGNVTSQ